MGLIDGLINRWFKTGVSADDADASNPEVLTPARGAIRFVGATVTDVPEKNRTDVEISAGTVADDSVTNEKLADMATQRIKGRTTAGTGDPEDLTPAQVRTMLNVADGATNDTAALATLSGRVTAVEPIERTGSIDWTAVQAYASLGAVIPVTASTATLYRVSIEVDHPQMSDGGGEPVVLPAKLEAADLLVILWRNGSGVAAAVLQDGATSPLNVGDADIQFVDSAGSIQIQVRKDAALTTTSGTAQVRVSLRARVSVPWTADTTPTIQAFGGAGVTISSSTPAAPTVAGAAGSTGQVSDAGHQHPRQTTLGVASGETPAVGNASGATTIAGSTITETVGSTSRTQTSSSLVRIDQTPTGPLYVFASSTSGGQTNMAQVRQYAAADGSRWDWAYDGTVGLGLKVNPAGTCDIEVPSGVTSLDTLKGGTRRLRIGANGIAGGLATASGLQSFAMGDATVVASGSHSWASGYNVETTKTYGVSMGANNDNIGVAAVQIGENLSNSDDSANVSQIGFQQTVGTNSQFASLIGCYINVGANSGGAFACGQSTTVEPNRPGSFQHSSGCDRFADLGWIGMTRVCTAAPAALQTRAGGAFFPEFYSFGVYTIEIEACTDDAVKFASAEIKVEVASAIANLTLGAITTVRTSLAAHGWSVSITEEASGELRITCDPGTDTVQFAARLSYSRIGATYAIA